MPCFDPESLRFCIFMPVIRNDFTCNCARQEKCWGHANVLSSWALCRHSDLGHLESGPQGSGGLTSDRCQLRRGSGALSNEDLGPQKRQCLPQHGRDLQHHYHSMPSQVRILTHCTRLPVEALCVCIEVPEMLSQC